MHEFSVEAADDVELRGAVHGDSSSAVAPLVLVHGFTGSSLDWVDVLDELAADRRVVTFDNRGHGRSGRAEPGSYRLDLMVTDLAAVVEAAGIGGERFHLLGHSMGGMISMRYALGEQRRGNDTLASLTLMDTSASPVTGIATLFGPAFDIARTDGMAGVMTLIEPFIPAGPVLDRMRVKFAQMDPVAFIELADELATAPSVLDQLVGLAIPTLVLVGELDTPFREPSASMSSAIPDARLTVIPGAAHSPQEDRPVEWLAAVRHHLADLI